MANNKTNGTALGTDNSVAAGSLKTVILSGVSVNFRYVPAGSFQRDGTASNVSVISTGYWMAETETTQELFAAVMGENNNPSYFDGTEGGDQATPTGETQNKRPVENVNWYHAITFCNKLSIADGKEPVYSVKAGETEIDWAGLSYAQIPTTEDSGWNSVTMDMNKNGYRLPTEMEWMWAAMGADKTSQPNTTGYAKAFAGSDGSNSIDAYAWYGTNSDDKTHEAGKKSANELGLRDMSGNVWEWCWGLYDSYPSNELTDFAGADLGAYGVVRGGSWFNDASGCTVAIRYGYSPKNRYIQLGFRFAMVNNKTNGTALGTALGTDNSIAAGSLKTLVQSGVEVNFRYVPPGSFQRDRTASNISVISKGYWLAEIETTQELFQAVMGVNPSYFDGTEGGDKATHPGETQSKRPVENVNWYHAITFCNKLSIADGKEPVYSVKEGGAEIDWAGLSYGRIPTTEDDGWNGVIMDRSKNGYRLPTEMEWMWAAMGADKTDQPNTTGYAKAFAGDNGSNSIDAYAWCTTNADGKSHEAGTKAANELGLKDMSGNLWEWCWDWFGDTNGDDETVADSGELIDYQGAPSGVFRVLRGGWWGYNASFCAVSYHFGGGPPGLGGSVGFRLACS